MRKRNLTGCDGGIEEAAQQLENLAMFVRGLSFGGKTDSRWRQVPSEMPPSSANGMHVWVSDGKLVKLARFSTRRLYSGLEQRAVSPENRPQWCFVNHPLKNPVTHWMECSMPQPPILATDESRE